MCANGAGQCSEALFSTDVMLSTQSRFGQWSETAVVNSVHCPPCTVLGTEPFLLQNISVSSFKRAASVFPSGIVV